MFIIIRYIIKKESTENDGDDQNGGSLPSTRIGYETFLEWLILTIMKFQIVCPIDVGLSEISNAHIISYFYLQYLTPLYKF